jgi:anti-anti-sigma factor
MTLARDRSRVRAASLPAPFSIDVQPDRELVRVRLAGGLDLATSDRLLQQLKELLDAGFDHVAIDLRELLFIDSSGLRLLLRRACRRPT